MVIRRMCLALIGTAVIAGCATGSKVQFFNDSGYDRIEAGDYDRARADFNEALRYNAKCARAYTGRGETYRLQGWHDEALRDFNTAIRFDSEYAAAYWSRGMVYRDLGDIDRAIADFDRALRLDPEYAEVKEARQGASK